MDSEELIRIENLTKAYHVGDITVQALRGVSLSIAKGSFVAISGPVGFREIDIHEHSRLSG